MNKTRRTLLRIAGATIVALVSVSSFTQEWGPVLSKKEVKVLLRTTKGPAEHRQIAEYYRQQASRLNASSMDHERAATGYDRGTRDSDLPSKHWATRFNHPANHCRAYAKSDAKKARKAESVAMLHEEMAKAAEQRQP